MQVSINVQDDLYKRFVESGADIQTKFNEYLLTLLDNKDSYLNSKQFQEDKIYFNDALNEIDNGNDKPLNQKEYDKEMNEFLKTL
ncbi:MAG: hypothetical protein GQ570_12470 [Helicobacteraceae bacterium]|nr:hypothetical protein [Helicobacteraceae bacterium]